MIHKHDPEKYQYNKSDILHFNGFSPENYFSMGAGEEDEATIAIENIIDRMGFDEYFTLVRYLRENNADLARFITRHTIHFNAYLRSIHEAKRQEKKDKYLDMQIQLAELKLSTYVNPNTGEIS